jgi:hypothetical protein
LLYIATAEWDADDTKHMQKHLVDSIVHKKPKKQSAEKSFYCSE